MADCLIGLGSNMGDRAGQLDQAIQLFCHSSRIVLQGASSYHETPPIGGPVGQASFLNAVIRVDTDWSPGELLAQARHVERELGRERLQGWGPRSIDVDLLLYNHLAMATEELEIPHPRMAVRRFVLDPAIEVGADMIHPPTGWTVQQLRNRLDRLPHYVAMCSAHASWCTTLVAAATQQIGGTALHECSRAAGRDFGAREARSASALEAELAWLTARSRILRLMESSGASSRLFFSDFWLNQSLAVARTWARADARRALHKACEAAIQQSPRPHVVVHLTSAGSAETGEGGAPRAAEPPPISSSLDVQLRYQLRQPGQSPVLHLPYDGSQPHAEAAVAALRAAVDAMRKISDNQL